MRDFLITNTLSRTKELFRPLVPGHIGLYVCGPTVYGDAHLGHARPGVTYDVFVRLMRHLGYKVRYVRNITDVGHLEHDADEGEDKIAKKARLEQLEPMEVVQRYTLRYHESMRLLNVAPPSIEPRASGHIIEQIQLVRKILDAGYAYVSNGSVYFDVEKYSRDHKYGILSGRTLEGTLGGTRALDGGQDKRNPWDFALWKKASPEHIMHWPSPWSEGFPGWHLECSAMSEKYLGRTFDIHGGGMDLMFPHHECELAQNTASRGEGGVRYWMHNNLITINGKKMGKSLGNFITLEELFTGSHELLEQAYSPMTIRFFILQAHYRGTLDFSNEALKAAEKAMKRLMAAARDLRDMASAAGITSPVTGTEGHPADALAYGEFITDTAPEAVANGPHDADTAPNANAAKANPSPAVGKIIDGVYDALCDDLNTPVAISWLFEAARLVNTAKDNKGALTKDDLAALLRLFDDIVYGVLGLTEGGNDSDGKLSGTVAGLMDIILEQRSAARQARDWAASDRIRDELKALGITVKDTKDGAEWSL